MEYKKTKKTFFTIYLILLFLLFTSSNKSNALPPVSEFPCVCCPVDFRQLNIDCIPPDFLLSEDMENAIGEISQALKELSKDSKSSRTFSYRINLYLRKIKNALRLSADKCNETITFSLGHIDSLLAKLQSKTCTETNKKNCIPEETLSNHIPTITTSLEKLKSIFNTDDDESGVSDVCRE